MRILHAALPAVLTLGLTATPASAATFYLTTGVGTHPTTIDADNPLTWEIFGDSYYSNLAGGVFAMRYDPGTTFGIQMELFNDSSEVVSHVSFADVAAYIDAGGKSEFDRFAFVMDMIGYTLPNGFYFKVKLSLLGDGDPSGQSYTISGFDGAVTPVATEDPNTITVTSTEPVSAVTTPEPASALIVGAGLLGLGLVRRHARNTTR